MKTFIKPILLFILFFTIKTSIAQPGSTEIVVRDLSPTLIFGYCTPVPSAISYEFIYSSPGFATQRANSSSNNFSFSVNHTNFHSIYLNITVVEEGRYHFIHKELILTVFTVYEDIIHSLNCEKVNTTDVVTQLPFQAQYTNPDYNLCALCKYLNLVHNNPTMYQIDEFSAFESYYIIDMDYINDYCHHDIDVYNNDPANYDFCNDKITPNINRKVTQNPSENQVIEPGSICEIYNMQGALVYNKLFSDKIFYTDIKQLIPDFETKGIFVVHIQKDHIIQINQKLAN